MNFDLAQLFSLPGIFVGVALSSVAWMFLDKAIAKKVGGGAAMADDGQLLVALQAELDANKESQAKVNEVHEYARQLEAKIQQLESTSDSADSELRVKVLEKQLSEKADLESKLAIAQQQLEDYRAKAEMYDTMVGAAPEVEPEVEVETEPAALAEPETETEAEPIVAAEEPAELEEPAAVEADEPVEVTLAEVFEEELAPVEVAAEEPAAELEEPKEEESIAAVASAEPVEITLVENELVAKGPASPAGAVAPAIDDRPALRIESVAMPLLDGREPLEKIEGIGQVYQTKLYDAGITTFAQLAASSPSRITEIIEPQNWQQIDVMKWRREAALYASGEKS